MKNILFLFPLHSHTKGNILLYMKAWAQADSSIAVPSCGFFVLSHSIVVPPLFHNESFGSQKYLHAYSLYPWYDTQKYPKVFPTVFLTSLFSQPHILLFWFTFCFKILLTSIFLMKSSWKLTILCICMSEKNLYLTVYLISKLAEYWISLLK